VNGAGEGADLYNLSYLPHKSYFFEVSEIGEVAASGYASLSRCGWAFFFTCMLSSSQGDVCGWV
jgi:hypothetical protein